MSFQFPELSFSLSSFSGKNLLISVALLYTIGLSAFLIFNTLKFTAPITKYESIAAVSISETGPYTYCESDKDCWCRYFDGAKFKNQKSPSVCYKQTNKCAKCIYE